MKRWKVTLAGVSFALALGALGVVGLALSQAAGHVLSVLMDRFLGRVAERVQQTGPVTVHGDWPPFPNPYWNQTAWFFDPQNASTCASDDNDGKQSTCGPGVLQGPIQHWSETARRWGSGVINYSPQQPHADVTFTLMDSQLDNNDPVIFRPVMLPSVDGAPNGNTYLFECTKALSSATSVSTVQQKITTTNGAPTFFQVTYGTAPTRGQMIQNTTHSSITFEGNYNSPSQMDQPLAPTTSAGSGAPIPFPAEVNTWAVADTIDLYNLPQWTFADIEPTAVGLAGFNVVIVQNCWIQEQNAILVQPGDDKLIVGNGVQLVEDFSERDVVSNVTSESYTCSSGIINSQLMGGFNGGTTVSTPPSLTTKTCPYTIVGGAITTQNTTGVGASSLDNVAIIHGTGFHTHTAPAGVPVNLQGYNYMGEAVTWAAQDIIQPIAGSVLDLRNPGLTLGESGNLWGNGKLNPFGGGQVLYNATAIDAGAMALVTLELNGLTTGCCTTPTAPATTNCAITLNQTTLGVLSCSDAGLNNQAFAPTGGGYQGF